MRLDIPKSPPKCLNCGVEKRTGIKKCNDSLFPDIYRPKPHRWSK